MTLPTNYQGHYVYVHKCPISKEIVYVGRGQKERAWRMSNAGGVSPKYGHRTKDHYEWFLFYESKGYTMGDIVQIVAQGLNKEEAISIEGMWLDKYRPKFNQEYGLKILTLTKDMYDKMLAMRLDGASYSAIAETIGSSTMTVYRAIQNKTKGYKNGFRAST